MAKITIEIIREAIEADSWELVSEEYKNLKEILHFRCNEGHDVYAPYEKIRKKRYCPVCKENVFKNQDTSIVAKTEATRTLALDQSTNITAWAIYDGLKLTKFGVFSATGVNSAIRFVDFKNWVSSLIQNWQPDQIVIEDIQLQSFPGQKSNSAGLMTYKVLAQLQGILIMLITEENIPLKIAPTPSWKSYCGVKGRSRADQKRSMQNLVKQWYDISVSDDESDAIGIGKYGVERLFNEPKMLVF